MSIKHVASSASYTVKIHDSISLLIHFFGLLTTTQICGNNSKVEDSSYQASRLPLDLIPG